MARIVQKRSKLLHCFGALNSSKSSHVACNRLLMRWMAANRGLPVQCLLGMAVL